MVVLLGLPTRRNSFSYNRYPQNIGFLTIYSHSCALLSVSQFNLIIFHYLFRIFQARNRKNWAGEHRILRTMPRARALSYGYISSHKLCEHFTPYGDTRNPFATYAYHQLMRCVVSPYTSLKILIEPSARYTGYKASRGLICTTGFC